MKIENAIRKEGAFYVVEEQKSAYDEIVENIRRYEEEDYIVDSIAIGRNVYEDLVKEIDFINPCPVMEHFDICGAKVYPEASIEGIKVVGIGTEW